MPELKPEFIANMRALLGEEAGAFFRALEEAPSLALRPHRGMEAAEPFIEGAVPWAEGGFSLRPGARPGASVAHWAGAFYLQEASAMLPAAALKAKPGERVLDLCAAPGGKSSQIALSMGGEGMLVANEVDTARARVLAANLERLGVTNAVVLNETPARLAARWPEYFDAVLVDAPCSGEGMFRRDPQSREAWTDAAPRGCRKRQGEILDAAAKLVRPGGRLLYSTCTFNGEENEGKRGGLFCRRTRTLPRRSSPCRGWVRPGAACCVSGRIARAATASLPPCCAVQGAPGMPERGRRRGPAWSSERFSRAGTARTVPGAGPPPSRRLHRHVARRAAKSAPRPPRGQGCAHAGRGRAPSGAGKMRRFRAARLAAERPPAPGGPPPDRRAAGRAGTGRPARRFPRPRPPARRDGPRGAGARPGHGAFAGAWRGARRR